MKNIKLLAVMTVLVTSSVAYCMEQKPVKQVKSLKKIAGCAVCRKKLLHKIQIPELVHDTQLMYELDLMRDNLFFKQDSNNLDVLIYNYADLEKLKELYQDEHSFVRIHDKCSEIFNTELLLIKILDGSLLTQESTSEQVKLMKAVVSNDIASLKSLGQSETVNEIINNLYEPWGVIPLVEGARRGFCDTVALLLEMGADINKANKYGKTALIVAALNGHLQTVKFLLAHNADATAKDNNGLTAAFAALSNGHTEIIAYLLEQRVDFTINATFGVYSVFSKSAPYDPLAMAVRTADINIVKLIWNNVADCKKSLNNSLIAATQVGNREIFDFLVRNGADIHYLPDPEKNSLLMIASIFGNSQIVQCLLDFNVDVDATNLHGNTALMYAAKYGHKEIVKLLLDHGATIESANNAGTTPLMYAAMSGNVSLIKLLVHAGASVVAQAVDGMTALLFAIIFGHIQVAEFLISIGAPIDYVDQQGNSPLLYACIHGYADIAATLVAHNAPVNVVNKDKMTPLLYASSPGVDHKIMELLLQHGAHVDAADKYENTSLLKAVMHKSREKVRLLLDFGADIEHVSIFSDTAESIASSYGLNEILDLINNKKAEMGRQ